MPEQPQDEINYVSSFSSERIKAQGVDVDELELTKTMFTEGDNIFISQMGTTYGPNFTTGWTPSSNESNFFVYKYYNGEEEASWESGYNFEHVSNPLTWSGIRSMGQAGNSFSLYAMYYPIDEKVTYNVQTDQTKPDNFKRSDILGAFHATPALYERLRFKFYHLMSYLHVKLYVPVAKLKEDHESYSGYEADALESALLWNAIISFGIDWRANRSSDTKGPLITIEEPNNSKSNIKMFRHPFEEDKTEIIDVRNYYDKGELDKDEVRVYEFSVLFPAQKFENSHILQFMLKSPGENTASHTYWFDSRQLVVGGTDFRFDQGILQHLTLYLPREKNETILIGANIIDWSNVSTGMTVTEQKSDSNTPDNPEKD